MAAARRCSTPTYFRFAHLCCADALLRVCTCFVTVVLLWLSRFDLPSSLSGPRAIFVSHIGFLKVSHTFTTPFVFVALDIFCCKWQLLAHVRHRPGFRFAHLCCADALLRVCTCFVTVVLLWLCRFDLLSSLTGSRAVFVSHIGFL